MGRSVNKSTTMKQVYDLDYRSTCAQKMCIIINEILLAINQFWQEKK
jgi:hypothetical protein